MAYDLLKREFCNITGLTGDSLKAYTIQDVLYGINNALCEAGIPFGLLDPRYRQHPWYLRQELLGEPQILEYFHAQENSFLRRKRQHDSDPNALDKDDPWIYFQGYPKWPLVPARDLPAAYLVLGYTLDSCTTLSFRFRPTDVYDIYPEFFDQESITQANGGEFKPEVYLTPANQAEFFEILWKHIEQDLADHGLLETVKSAVDNLTPEMHSDEHTPVTLIEFMQRYCEPQSLKLLRYRRKSLNEASRRSKIRLPDCVGSWKSGKSKCYSAGDLKQNWPSYREVLSSLPSLRK